jgi:nucleoside-triphosphatase
MKPHRVFFTGEPGCGKTTVLKNTIQGLTSHGMKVGGMLSGEIRDQGVRVGFSLEDVLTHATGTLAHVNQSVGPRIGKYRVNLEDLEKVGVTAIERAINEPEVNVIAVDELGPMELNSDSFVRAVRDALVAPKHFVGTIHKRASHSLVLEIKRYPTFQIVEITPESRDAIPGEIAKKILS